jgi:hypothetical protein
MLPSFFPSLLPQRPIDTTNNNIFRREDNNKQAAIAHTCGFFLILEKPGEEAREDHDKAASAVPASTFFCGPVVSVSPK